MKLRYFLAVMTAVLLLPMQGIPAVAEQRVFEHGVDTWCFGNTPSVLGETYQLTDADRAVMRNAFTHTERRRIEQILQSSSVGYCYGLAVSSILAYDGILSPGEYADHAESLHDVQPSAKTNSMIAYYQQMQCTYAMRQEMIWSKYHETQEERLNKLIALAKAGTPALVEYTGFFSSTQQMAGHVVAAYGYQEGEWTWKNQTYSVCIQVYDPNFPKYDRLFCIYIQPDTGAWCVPGYRLYSEKGNQISFVTADTALLNHDGLIGGTQYVSDKPHFAILNSNRPEGGYSCHKTCFHDNQWRDLPEDTDIQTFQYAYGTSIVSSDMDFVSPDLESGYCLTVQQEQPLDAAMWYENLLMSAEGNANAVRFSPDGSFAIESSGQPYTLEIVRDQDYPGTMYDLTVSGNARTAQLSVTENGYLLRSEDMHHVTVKGNGDDSEDTACFSTDADEVLIYETAEHTLAAAIDADGNGSFETVLVDENKPDKQKRFKFGVDTWQFANTMFAFGSYYYLHPDDIEIMKSKFSNTEKMEAQDAINRKWMGDCYGMAVTSILAYHGILQPQQLQEGASCAHDVELDERMVSLITYYQQLQCLDSTQQEIAWSKYYETSEERLSHLLELVRSGTPALLCYNGHFMDADDISGHAVVAYGYEEGAWEWDGQAYDAKILIYDPNTTIQDELVCLYLDTEKGNWRIPGYRLSSENDAQITFVTADVSLLNNCGLIGGTRFRSDKPHFAFLKSMALEGGYTVSKTTFDENGWKDTEVADDIKEFHNAFGESLNFSDVNFLTPDLNSGYYLKAENEQPLDVSMQYDGILIMADGTAQAVHFSPEGTCRVDSTGQPYHLEYVFNEDYPGTMYYHEFSGNAAYIQVTATPEGYVLESDRLQDVTVNAIGGGNNGKLTFSVDAEKALVYETEEHTLAVAVDTDDNGSFETTIAESYTLGDVNRDGSINAKDASEVLMAASHIGTGQEAGLTDVQQKAADVDRDGNINAVDAGWILRYAAAIGTGTAESTMEEYIKH